jgi:hypothetical protein
VLLDAGLSAADVASMRRQFYESRGEEVPEGMDLGDISEPVLAGLKTMIELIE